MKKSLALYLALMLTMTCFLACRAGHNDENSSVNKAAAEDSQSNVPRPFSIVFAGDAMQHKGQLASARKADGSYDYSECFTQVKPYIESADYAVVNLETTLSDSDFSGYPMFCTPASYAQELKNAGFDLFLTANNHCLDRRDKGLMRTLDYLDGMDIPHVGTYRNAAERDSVLPQIKNIGNVNVAFLDYTYGTNGIEIQKDVVVDYINRDKIHSDIVKAREAGADLVCVAVHWGNEYVLLPNESQKSLAKFLVNEGVDLIIGAHPHVIQPIEIVKNESTGRDVLLVWSLGNFISDMKKTDTSGGIMVKAFIDIDKDGRPYVKGAEYLPVFTVRGVPGKSNHHLVIADSAKTDLSRAFLKNAYHIFDTHNKGVARSTFDSPNQGASVNK